jgi:hypothetical protein
LTVPRLTLTGGTHHHTSRAGRKAAWQQIFGKGYIKQAFSRVSVRARLLHGEENAAYSQRADFALTRSPARQARPGPAGPARARPVRGPPSTT